MSFLVRARSSVSLTLRRNIGFTAIVANKAVASLPLTPFRNFSFSPCRSTHRRATAGGKIVESNAETEKELKQELDRVSKNFGGGAGVDMTKFPTFQFKDPALDPIDQAPQA